MIGLPRMAERGRPKAPLVLTDQKRQQLQRWTRRAKTAQAWALRAKIVLATAWPSVFRCLDRDPGVASISAAVTLLRLDFVAFPAVEQHSESHADTARPAVLT